MKKNFLILIIICITLVFFEKDIYASGNLETKIEFTKEERLYIENKNKVTMLVDPDWYPYEKIDSKGNHVGIAADLLSLIEIRTGLEFELIPTLDWNESIEKSKRGEADIISLLNETLERQKWLLFTNPYYVDPNVLITREEHEYISNLHRFENETIVLPGGTSIEERLRKEYPKLKILLVNSEKEALSMVSSKKADMTLRSLTMAAYIIKNDGYFNLKIAGELSGYENLLRIGITNNSVILKSILNKGIESITEQEKQSIINKHISIKVQKGFDYKLFVVIFSLFSIILFISFYWLKKVNNLNKILNERQTELEILNSRVFESERLYKSILNASPDAIVLMGLDKTILMSSISAKEVLGEEEDNLVGKNILKYFKAPEYLRVEENIVKLIKNKKIGTTRYDGIKNKDTVYEVNSRVINDEKDNPIYIVSIIRDITETVRNEQELKLKNLSLKEKATIDNLTGIKNRYYFDERIQLEIRKALFYKSDLSLIIFDLDHFKFVNDTFGHDVGDKVLIRVVDIVRKNIRKSDIFARWGGEEFVILMPQTDLTEALKAAEKIRIAVEMIEHPEIQRITISLGVTFWQDFETSDGFFKKADTALYKAKNGGRNKVEMFK